MAGFVGLIIFIAGVWGYIANIVDVIHAAHVPAMDWTIGLVFHVIGIFLPPLGALMGLFF